MLSSLEDKKYADKSRLSAPAIGSTTINPSRHAVQLNNIHRQTGPRGWRLFSSENDADADQDIDKT